MPVDVKMPQLGESVFEGTVGKWLKAVGDHVERYEPLLEVITDKVDTEVTASDSGTLLEIAVPEGETVKVGTVLARIGAAGEQPATGLAPSGANAVSAGPASNGAAAPAPTPAHPVAPPPAAVQTASVATPAVLGRVSPVAARAAAELGVDLAGVSGTGRGGQITREDVERAAARAGGSLETPANQGLVGAGVAATSTAAGSSATNGTNGRLQPGESRDVGFVSPRVGMLAAKYSVNLGEVPGTGKDGRITARDVEAFVARRGEQPATAAPTMRAAATTAAPTTGAVRPASPMLGELIELTPMRRAIAEHMVRSKATAPHVTTVHEVDMSRVMATYEAQKGPMADRGVKLTLTAILVDALAQSIAEHPLVNSSLTEAGLQIHRDINIGMAVAVPQGLIVPVIKHADEKNLQGLARDITDLSTRARNKQLLPDDVQGGTFTLTNYGTLGSLFGTPVISQPQTAILGAGAIKKRVVVIEGPDGDSIGIRPMMFLALTFDHRVLDGGSADPFMQTLVRRLESYGN